MWNFVPGKYDLRTASIFCYHWKKTAAGSHRMLVEAHGEHALGKSQCFERLKNPEAAILTRGTKNVKDHRKSFETENRKHRWTRMTLKRNDNSLID